MSDTRMREALGNLRIAQLRALIEFTRPGTITLPGNMALALKGVMVNSGADRATHGSLNITPLSARAILPGKVMVPGLVNSIKARSCAILRFPSASLIRVSLIRAGPG